MKRLHLQRSVKFGSSLIILLQ